MGSSIQALDEGLISAADSIEARRRDTATFDMRGAGRLAGQRPLDGRVRHLLLAKYGFVEVLAYVYF